MRLQSTSGRLAGIGSFELLIKAFQVSRAMYGSPDNAQDGGRFQTLDLGQEADEVIHSVI